MNSEQAKQIRIEEYLYRIGIKPNKERGHNLWYKSPFRNETEPSFKVNRNINQWHDLGSGDKGNIIRPAFRKRCKPSSKSYPIHKTVLFLFVSKKFQRR